MVPWRNLRGITNSSLLMLRRCQHIETHSWEDENWCVINTQQQWQRHCHPKQNHAGPYVCRCNRNSQDNKANPIVTMKTMMDLQISKVFTLGLGDAVVHYIQQMSFTFKPQFFLISWITYESMLGPLGFVGLRDPLLIVLTKWYMVAPRNVKSEPIRMTDIASRARE